MSQQELSVLLYAYALGALDKEDYIRLLDYLESNGDYPWQDLGEFQNLASLLPSFLVLQEPHPSIKDKVARKLYRLKEFRRTSPGISAPARPEMKRAEEKAPEGHRQPSFLKTIERRTIEQIPEQPVQAAPEFPGFMSKEEPPAVPDFPPMPAFTPVTPFEQEEAPKQDFGNPEFDTTEYHFGETEEQAFGKPGFGIPDPDEHLNNDLFKTSETEEEDKPVYSPPPFVDMPPFHGGTIETTPEEDEIPRFGNFSFPEEPEATGEEQDSNPFGRPDPNSARPRQNTQIRGRNQNPAPPQRNAGERPEEPVVPRQQRPAAPEPPKAPAYQEPEEEIFEIDTPPAESEQFIFDHTDVNAFNPDFQESTAPKSPFSFSIDPGRQTPDLFQTQETLPQNQNNLSFEDIRRKVVEDVKREEEVKPTPPPVVVKEKSSPLVTILIFVLLITGCAGVYFLIDMKYKKEISSLNAKIQTTSNEIKDTENKLSKEGGIDREVLNMLTDKSVRLASMNAVKKESTMYGKVIYSLEQKKGFLQLVNFVTAPKGKQYHLWINLNGKTQHIIAITDANIGFRYVKLDNLPEFETAKTNLLIITEEDDNSKLENPSATRLLTGQF